MTDTPAKRALDELLPILPHLSGMGGSTYRSELGVIAGRNIDVIINALRTLDEVEKYCKRSNYTWSNFDVQGTAQDHINLGALWLANTLKEIADGNE